MSLVPILLYHTVSDEPSPLMRPFTVTPTAFGRQLDAVVSSGVTVLPVSDFVRRRETGTLPSRPAVITFDDGFADFAEHALPALAERGLASVLYVTTGFLDGCPATPAQARPADATLHWSQLAELTATGVEIGAHSHTHPYLDTLPAAAAREEIVRSKALLEDELGRPVESFAYPNGYSSAAVRRLVREAGYRSACAVGNTLSSAGDDRFALARLTVRDTTTTAELARWLEGTGAPPPRTRERVSTRAWRAYRRTRAVAAGVPGSDFHRR
jgi:peptidoglycan/xylan/chitin deacetylase (PgdA/CDA1 family)